MLALNEAATDLGLWLLQQSIEFRTGLSSSRCKSLTLVSLSRKRTDAQVGIRLMNRCCS